MRHASRTLVAALITLALVLSLMFVFWGFLVAGLAKAARHGLVD